MRRGLGEAGAIISVASVHAEQQLHAQSDARVPSEWEDADVARHDGRAQEVLHGGGAVRVAIEDLGRETREQGQDIIQIGLTSI